MRLVLAGGFFAALNMYRYPDTNALWAQIAIVLFVIAAVTDWLDGYLARKWEVTSVFGRVMDPFCDKVLILGAFVFLAGPRFVIPERVEQDAIFNMATGLYPWMVVVVLARELLVTSIRGVVESMGVSFASTWSGKWKMILQSIAIPIVLFLTVHFDPMQYTWSNWTIEILVYLMIVVTVWSGVPYLVQARHVLRARRDESKGAST